MSRRCQDESRGVKVNEFLYRRADTEDIVSAHFAALERAQTVGFGWYIGTATTPFARGSAASCARTQRAL